MSYNNEPWRGFHRASQPFLPVLGTIRATRGKNSVQPLYHFPYRLGSEPQVTLAGRLKEKIAHYHRLGIRHRQATAEAFAKEGADIVRIFLHDEEGA